MKLSHSAEITLAALACDPNVVVMTLRTIRDGIETDDWRASVAPRERAARFTVPIQTFRKMRRLGLLVKACEWDVGGGLIHSEYVLADAGQAALAAV